jgi:1-aminocyclopropane-1-carboxylate deaminase/D-cysteine desulfhydrase-like pyridoxal-dependent ACC family enzyme
MAHRVHLEELAALRGAPRAELGQWPTPLVEVELRGLPKILVKRDDLSGWGRGGAKARKIEHLIGYMLARGYTDLVTVAGNVTNLAFDLLPAMDRYGLGVHLHIIDDPPTRAARRAEIFGSIGPRLTLLGPTRAEAFRRTWQAWFALRRQGRRPLWVLPGVSHPSGVIGNALGYLELAEQCEQSGRRLHTVFVTAATGTTLAGFALAERLLRLSGKPPTRVVGAQIYPGRMRQSARWLSRWAGLANAGRLPRAISLDVSSAALGAGFGRFDARLVELCARVRSETGLELDPIFGGKTWSVMEDAIGREHPQDGAFLYWHCGFTPEWQTLGQGLAPA